MLEALRRVRNICRNRRNFRRNRRNIRRNRRGSRNLVHSSMVGAQHSPQLPWVADPCSKLYGGCATFAAIAASRGTLFITLRWVRNIRRILHGSWNHVGSSTTGAQHSPQSVQLSPQSPQHSPQSPRVAEPCSYLYGGCETFSAFATGRGTLLVALRRVRNIRRNRRNIRRNPRWSRNLVHSSMLGAHHSPQLPWIADPCS